MRKRFITQNIGLLTLVCCLAILAGCIGGNKTKIEIIEPSQDTYVTDAETGKVEVPFEAVFWRNSDDEDPFDPENIFIQMHRPTHYWPWDYTLIYDGDGDPDLYGLGLPSGPEGENNEYTVSGTMMLLTPGKYTIMPNYGVNDSADPMMSFAKKRIITVESGFSPEYYIGATHAFGDMPEIEGVCFWTSTFTILLNQKTLETFLAAIFAVMMNGEDLDGVTLPGWADLPQTVTLVEESSQHPAIEAVFSQGVDQIDVSAEPVDVTLNEDDWMKFDLSNSEYQQGVYYICGYEFQINTGALVPYDTNSANLEINFTNMAYKISVEVDGVKGECFARRANSLFEVNTYFDAITDSECTATYEPAYYANPNQE